MNAECRMPELGSIEADIEASLHALVVVLLFEHCIYLSVI